MTSAPASSAVPPMDPDLENALNEMFPSEDPLDTVDFDVIEYINQRFPDEQSLLSKNDDDGNDDGDPKALGAFLTHMQRRIISANDDISRSVRQHACQRGKTRQAVADSKQSIQQLFEKIHAIKEKAEQSEVMVQEICRDIKSLDNAKKHLTHTITALQQLRMLVSAVDQLMYNAQKKQYRDCAQLIRAVEDFFCHFEAYTDVPQIHELSSKVARTKIDLKQMIFRDFRNFGPNPVVGIEHNVAMLNDACSVVDVLGNDVRSELLHWFVDTQMDGYKQVFSPGMEGGTLEQTERRYAWLNRTLKAYEEVFGSIFPSAWNLPRLITEKFIARTRKHLNTILSQAQGNFDVNLLIRIVQRTKDFELQTTMKYRSIQQQEQRRASATAPESSPSASSSSSSAKDPIDYNGSISEVFFGYLGGYVELERANMDELIEKGIREEIWSLPREHPAKARTKGSDDLFVYIKRSMTRCGRLTTGQILYNITKEYERALGVYGRKLDTQLPYRPDTVSDVNRVDLEKCCILLNSAEYCGETIPSLQESIAKTIDGPFKEHIDLGEAQQVFQMLVSTVTMVMVNGVCALLTKELVAMSKLPWSTWEGVGDQSEWVNNINGILKNTVPCIAIAISKAHFNFFCTTLASSFIPRVEEYIYKCKKVSQWAQHQLRLDVYALKSLILQIPTLGGGANAKPSRTFERIVSREMGRVEAMLKVLDTSADQLIPTFKQLLPKVAKSGEGAEILSKIMDLKGLKRSEQQTLVDDYNNNVADTERMVAPPDSAVSIRKLFTFTSTKKT